MKSVTYPKYRYNGAKSLIILHEKYLTSFYHIWGDAKNLNISLPKSNDKDYLTLETLLKHVLRSSAGYIEWICEKLDLPDPQIKEIPQDDIIQKEAENFITHLIEIWSSQLADVEESAFHSPTYVSNWGVNFLE